MTDPACYARLDALKARLAQPTPQPLAGQQAIPVATIADHYFEGDDTHCRAETFGQVCGEHRDAHQYNADTA